MTKTPLKLEQLADRIKEISEEIAKEEATLLAGPSAKRVRKKIGDAYEKLRRVMEDLDPIKHPGFVFDPSNPNVVGRIVGITMIAQPRKPLTIADRFYGSGVYAIYYAGAFPTYSAISKREHPIYVGKADPADPASKTAFEQGDKLSGRLNEHRKNIVKAAAESYLIDLFKPIWNNEVGICYGFGKHGDAPETRANLRSPWDTLHHGRDWAHRDPNMLDARPREQIVKDIARHFAEYPPLGSVDEILRRFLDEMREIA
jgi:hypothetical protein